MKYKNIKLTVNGESFDSKKEYTRYQELKIMQDKGLISGLERQHCFTILPTLYYTKKIQGKRKVKEVRRVLERAKHYTADFVYTDCSTDTYVIEDVKSAATSHARDYPLRRHLMQMLIQEWNQGGLKCKYNEYI